MAGWIGVDLDGTLAKYDGTSAGEIGPPVQLMLDRVKRWLEKGRDVRIFTARVGMPDAIGPEAQAETIRQIEMWCVRHIGRALPVTATKDYGMVELWDDRCVQVVPNTGRRVDGVGFHD